jgi:predicted ATP-dependent serine protease
MSNTSRTKRINDVTYDPQLFQAWEMNTPLDTMFSIAGGIPKATNWMVVGDPGVGKSTVLLDALANIKKNKGRVLFVSAEMNEIDLKLYVDRYPKFGDLDIFFPQDLEEGECPKQALADELQLGYDIVLYDSFVEIQETIKEAAGMSTKGSEKWMLDLMDKHNKGNNNRNCYTAFLNIQQVTKGGKFVGSNRLKHMTTGMMEIRFVEEDDDERYITFDKNRRGHVGKRMYFSLHSTGDVTYDVDRFNKAEKLYEMKKKEKELIKSGEASFDKLFKLQPGSEGAEESEKEPVKEEATK